MKIVLHDYFERAEGGGRLSLTLAKKLKTDLAYGFKAASHPFFQKSSFSGREYPLAQATPLPLLRQFLLAKAFRNKTEFLKNYSTAIYSGFYSPLASQHHLDGRNILYCHTPPRFIYDQKDFYLSQIPFFCRPLLKSFIRYLQPRYEESAAMMDTIVTNSENVRRRISNFLGKDSVVVHPPCETDKFKWQKAQGYYLSTARLDPLKRVELIVKAFTKMPDKELIVTSGGSEFKHLKIIARNASNIHFTGTVSEKTLQGLIAKCIATIYIPKDEDFGMSPVESMAAGKPVIGVKEGGIPETVTEDCTGVLLPAKLTTNHIIDAIKKTTPKKANQMRDACEARAQLFSQDIFIEKMRSIIAQQ